MYLSPSTDLSAASTFFGSTIKTGSHASTWNPENPSFSFENLVVKVKNVSSSVISDASRPANPGPLKGSMS